MMTPQLTEQYGHVERVSLARAIFSVRSCAYAGSKSKPNNAAAAPPTVVSLRKSRRVGFTSSPPSARDKVGNDLRKLLHRPRLAACQAFIFLRRFEPCSTG